MTDVRETGLLWHDPWRLFETCEGGGSLCGTATKKTFFCAASLREHFISNFIRWPNRYYWERNICSYPFIHVASKSEPSLHTRLVPQLTEIGANFLFAKGSCPKLTFLADMSAKDLSPPPSLMPWRTYEQKFKCSSCIKIYVLRLERKAWNGWFCNKKISGCEVWTCEG